MGRTLTPLRVRNVQRRARRGRVPSHSSRFLLELLKTDKPDQYKQLQTGLFNKAQQANDETILDNPYLQMRSVMDAKVPALGVSSSSASLVPPGAGAAGTTLHK